jgi:small conductance mechanosensitive channel
MFVSKVIDVADPAQPLVELTATAKAPPDVDAVKQPLLDRVNALLGNTDEVGVGPPAR